MDTAVMSKNNFFNYIQDNLGGLFSDPVEIDIKYIEKPGGSYNGCMLKKPGSRIQPTVNLDALYDVYSRNPDIEVALRTIYRLLSEKVPVNTDNIRNKIDDYNWVKENIFFKIVNADKTAPSIISKIVVDGLAMVPYIMIEKTAKGISSFAVPKNMLGIWEVTEEELIAEAFENAPKILPVKCASIPSMLGINDPDFLDTPPFFVVTTDCGLSGASSIFYPGVAKKIAEDIMDGDFYILPSSINEVIILPKFFDDPSELAEIVREINFTEVNPSERLSNNVYVYNVENDEIRRA